MHHVWCSHRQHSISYVLVMRRELAWQCAYRWGGSAALEQGLWLDSPGFPAGLPDAPVAMITSLPWDFTGPGASSAHASDPHMAVPCPSCSRSSLTWWLCPQCPPYLSLLGLLDSLCICCSCCWNSLFSAYPWGVCQGSQLLTWPYSCFPGFRLSHCCLEGYLA